MYNLDTGGMTNLWPGTEITLRFEDDGTVSGIGGCNNYSGTFEVEGPYDEFVEGALDENDGQAIHMGPFTVTEMACTSPNNVMEQETEYLDALQKAGRWLVARGNLILRTGDGFFLIEAEPDE
jgi:heat shock protein HslJ